MTTETVIISGFPGIGKSFLSAKFEGNEDIIIQDSDSSTFPKDNFPQNYIQHIKDSMGKANIILVSSHEEVVSALIEEGLTFTVVYPAINLKEDYLERYRSRNSPPAFIGLISENWEDWITAIEDNHKIPYKEELVRGEYLSDIVQLIEV